MTIVQAAKRFSRSKADSTATLTCPNDKWSFTPKYTDGVCPLCGYKPEGVEFHAPFAARVDWFWPSMVFMVAASIAMSILVLITYTHK